jgi:4-amino-4-deoxy-L-arabinose transferase-like glycosyltransferase
MPNLTQKPVRALAILWLLAVLMAWPVGDFPLDDDWSYAEAVKHLVDTGEYWVSDWPAMTLFTQVIWGGLFAKVLGFSFYTLRFSTLVLATLGILAFQKIMARLELPGWWQLVALLTLVFNPVFFELSLTFMTDVPFLSLMAMSLYAYLRAFEKDQWQWWAAATLFSSLAILLRQPALLLPLAMGIAGFLGRPGWRRLGLAFLSTAIVYLCLQGYILWQQSTSSGLPGAFSQPGSIRHLLTPEHVAGSMQNYGGLYLMYAGFMLLPILLLSPCRPRPKSAWALTGLLSAAGLALIALSWDEGLLGNTLHHRGLGTIPLQGVHHNGHWPSLPSWLGLPAKLLGVTGLLLLISHGSIRTIQLIQQFLPFRNNGWTGLNPVQTLRLGLCGFLLPYVLFLLVNYVHFDRYLLPVLLSGLLIIRPVGHARPQKRLAAAAVLLLLWYCFSIAGTHDYFAWNRARWTALNEALESGIPPEKIDGGFEFNGWYRTGPLRPKLPYAQSWWFVGEDTYVVSFGPYHNYTPVAVYPFQRILPPGKDTIFFLKRPEWADRDTMVYEMEPDGWPEEPGFAQLRSTEKTSLYPDSYNGTFAYRMAPGQEYGLTHRVFPVAPFDEFEYRLQARQEGGSTRLVLSAPDASQFHFTHQIHSSSANKKGWHRHEGSFRIPPSFPSDTLAFYFWKRPQDTIFIDDFRVIWKKSSPR